jgi:hypothetical protein
MEPMKKVLILTYYWPPAGGPGVQRVIKFVKYLPDFGYQPIVLTVSKGEYPAIDHSLEAEVPAGVRVVRTGTFEFFALFKRLTGRKKEERITTTILKADNPGWKDRIFRWIRYNLFYPDARIGWRWYALRAARKIIREEKPVLLFCTSPPHSAQWITRSLHRKTGIPWIADFRDPWTDAYWLRDLPKYPWAYRRNLAMERAVLAEANALITVSEGYQELLHKTGRRPQLIRNGFDAADFTRRKSPNPTFRIVYTGSLSQIQMPTNFLDALAGLSHEEQRMVQFDLYGAIDPQFFREAEERGIADLIKAHGYIPHDQVVNEMIQADLLLLLTPRTPSVGMTPLKLYEYLASGAFILGIGDTTSDPARILARCEGGQYVSYDTNVLPLLRHRIEVWQQHPDAQPDIHPGVRLLERRELTRQLAGVFDQVLAKEGGHNG